MNFPFKHEKADRDTFFGYFKDDKFIKRKGLGRIERTDTDGNSLWAKTKEDALLSYLEDRLPPETRTGLQWYLLAAGIPYYDPEQIIKYSHGYNVSDMEWIQLEGENYTFKEIEERAVRESKVLYDRIGQMLKDGRLKADGF